MVEAINDLFADIMEYIRLKKEQEERLKQDLAFDKATSKCHFQVTLLQVADLQWLAIGAVLGVIASDYGLSLPPSSRPACGVLTIDTVGACGY
jgi:hypothetical protein